MKVYALCSFYDERPDHLAAMVESLAGFADYLVVADGAYATFPAAKAASPPPQRAVIYETCKRVGIKPALWFRQHPWEGGEVEKRAALFEFGRRAGASPEDWFLIIDADMTLAYASEDARGLLESTDCDVAAVNWHDIGPGDGKPFSTMRFRSLFRAIPGLTVEHTHWLYVQHQEDGSRRFLWHGLDGGLSEEPCLDLAGNVTLHHRRQFRNPERNERAGQYYRERDAANLEAPQ